jgi:cell division protein FtsI/penicillin-binding protein 2
MSADSRGAHPGPRRRASWLLARYRTFVPPAHPDERTDPGQPGLPAQAGLISSPAPVNSRPPPQLDGYRSGGESEPDVPAGLGDPGQVDRSRLAQPSEPPAAVRSEEKSPDGPPTRPRRWLNGALSRSTLLRICGAAVVLGLVAAGLLSGGAPGTSAESTVQSFLLSWEQGEYLQAAQLTTGNPAAVASALRAAYDQIDAAALYLSMGRITQSGDSAHAQFNASVDLGQDGAAWNYTGRFGLHWTGSTWKVRWSPSVIVPGLRTGTRLAVRTSLAPRAPILDAAGRPLQSASAAYLVGVRPDRLSDPEATAVGISRATGLNIRQVLDQIRSAPQAPFLGLLTLDRDAYRELSSRLQDVPGLAVRKVSRRLFNSIAPDVVGLVGTESSRAFRQDGIAYQPGNTTGLSGLQQYYQRRLVGSPTTEVIVEDSRGRVVSVLHKWSGLRGSPVRTTLDVGAQSAANQALAGTGQAAAIVAVQASTGRVLAVASQPGRHSHIASPNPLAGHYPPGQAFTIVSTAALLDTGLSTGAPVPCTTASDVGGETFINNPPDQGLGAQPPFSADFARGCGTAFAGLSRRLTPGGLSGAAAAFGLGSSWRLPLAGFAGSMPAPATDAELAADTMGTGKIQVSPLSLALIAGQVDSGQWHAPSLVATPAAADPPLSTKSLVSQQTMGTLRDLMRDAVQTGSAQQADLPGQPVFGQAGQARLSGAGISGAGKGVRASWFAGYRGDVAFAVLELGKSSAGSAVPLAAQFLQHLPASLLGPGLGR